MSTHHDHAARFESKAMASDQGPAFKRSRSRSPPYNRRRAGSRERQDESHESKRFRGRDQYERPDWGSTYSSSYGEQHRSWHELSAEEQEREWQRYQWEQHHGSTRDLGYRDSRDRAAHGAHMSKGQPKDPMDLTTLLSFKKYTQLLRENGNEPAALSNGVEATQILYTKYMEYRKSFYKRAMKQIWQEHKTDKWFLEKYGASYAAQEARIQRRRIGRRGRKKLWLEELRSGQLDKVCWDVTAVGGVGADSTRLKAFDRFGHAILLDEAESVTIEADASQLLIKSIPVDIGRDDIEEVLKAQIGFQYLALGEPHPLKRFSRIGWAVFDPATADALEALSAELSTKAIGGQKLSFEVATRPAQAKLRLAPDVASTTPRLLQDIQQARKLVLRMEEEDRQDIFKGEEIGELDVDASKEIVERVYSTSPDIRSDSATWLKNQLSSTGDVAEDKNGVDMEQDTAILRRVLDLHLDVLREVYHCDYYTSTLCDFREELLRRAPRCGRKVPSSTGNLDDDKAHDRGRVWASNVDEKTRLLLGPDDNEIGEFGGIDLQQMLLDSAAPYSREDEIEKHRCTVKIDGEQECGKPFKAQIFVQKHVLNKHRDWFSAKMADDIAEVRSFNNYVRDPQRPMPSLQTDRVDAPGGAQAIDGAISTGGFYGSGTILRLGATQPAHAYGNGNVDHGDARTDAVLRMGATVTPSAALQRKPLPQNPRPLDPRATMAPKSYQDLDAGSSAQEADLELQY